MARKYLRRIGYVSVPLGFLLFWTGKTALLTDLMAGLIAVAAIIFGILGAWMSMLNPIKALDEEQEESRRRFEVALQLSPVLKQATLALAAGIFIRLLLPILPEVGDKSATATDWLLGLIRSGWELPEALTAFVASSTRSLLGASIIYLYLFEIVVLVLTLLPILSVERKQQEEGKKEELRNDPASAYDKIKG